MPPTLYSFPPSPPCRAVNLLARTLALDLQLRNVDIMAGEHLGVEYIKINPQHTIPTLDDDGFVLWESRAIMAYLADQYGQDETLYPKDPKKRAVVNQRLYFDTGTLHQRVQDYFVPVLFRGEAPDPDRFQKIEEAFGFLDLFLEGQEWVAGENMTIADFSIAVTTSNAQAFGVDLDQFPNVSQWYNQAKISMDGFEEINQAGADILGELFKAKTNN